MWKIYCDFSDSREKSSLKTEKFDLKRYFDIMTKDEKDIEKSQYKNNDVQLERVHYRFYEHD